MLNVKDLLRKDALASVKLLDNDATEKLGSDFSSVLYRDWQNTELEKLRLRFALLATPGTGKTTLTKGLFASLSNPLTIERRQDFLRQSRFGGKNITQKWFHSTEMGHVCHVDTGFGTEFWRILKPYRERLLEAQKLAGVDIVENAETDERHDQFDCAIWMEKSMDQEGNRFRQAYIYATENFAARPAFQDFLSKQNLVDPIGDIRHELN